jgi:uncharacterized RDD family membrane protein YckC
MAKNLLHPQGDLPPAGLIRRLAAIFYDSLLCCALLIVVAFFYKLIQIGIFGEAQLRQWSDTGALDGDPLLSSLLLLSLFGFFAKFWTHNGQTLGMQVWGVRVQNADGSAINLQQALLRFLIAILSWLVCFAGYLWVFVDKQKRTWHDIYSQSQVVKLPKDAHRK